MMNKVIDLVFPMISNCQANANLREKIHPKDENGQDIEPESILSYIENSDQINLDILKDRYDETFKTKEKIEDKAKTNIIGISISITLIMGASGILSVLNNKYLSPAVSWVAFVLIVVSIIYMLTAGILIIRLLTNENEVYMVTLSELASGGEILRDQYGKRISQNQNKNVIRNNYLFTSYECIRNSLVCLFVILILTTIPIDLKSDDISDNALYQSETYSIMYTSSAVDYIQKHDAQSIVERSIFEAVERIEKNNNAQALGIIDEKNHLFIKFRVIDDTIEILLIEPYI